MISDGPQRLNDSIYLLLRHSVWRISSQTGEVHCDCCMGEVAGPSHRLGRGAAADLLPAGPWKILICTKVVDLVLKFSPRLLGTKQG